MLRIFNKYYGQIFNRREGYTIDQTILIVAIIAILITLIIITIGWQLINRTSGTKLGSQLKQVEDSITQFYAANKVFPDQAFTATPTIAQTAVVLTGNTAGLTTLPSIQATNLSNFLGGFRTTGTAGSSVLNNSYGGTINIMRGDPTNFTGSPAGRQYLVVEFTQVPLSDAQEADRAIDNAMSNSAGRLVYNTTGCLTNTGGTFNAVSALTTTPATVFACYVAASTN